MGMDVADVIHNAPEWGARPGVAFVAVAKSACRVFAHGPASPTEILLREYPEVGPARDRDPGRAGPDVATTTS